MNYDSTFLSEKELPRMSRFMKEKDSQEEGRFQITLNTQPYQQNIINKQNITHGSSRLANTG